LIERIEKGWIYYESEKWEENRKNGDQRGTDTWYGFVQYYVYRGEEGKQAGIRICHCRGRRGDLTGYSGRLAAGFRPGKGDIERQFRPDRYY
jgi:hypothetical protein